VRAAQGQNTDIILFIHRFLLCRSRETSPVDAAAARAELSKSNLLGGMMTASSLSLQYLEAGFRIRIHLIRIRIQHFRLNTNPDPGFLSPKVDKQFTAEKKLNFFGSKTSIYLSLGFHKKEVPVTK
jgi:hypothetical protein